jgi:hypothetical protein
MQGEPSGPDLRLGPITHSDFERARFLSVIAYPMAPTSRSRYLSKSIVMEKNVTVEVSEKLRHIYQKVMMAGRLRKEIPVQVLVRAELSARGAHERHFNAEASAGPESPCNQLYRSLRASDNAEATGLTRVCTRSVGSLHPMHSRLQLANKAQL